MSQRRASVSESESQSDSQSHFQSQTRPETTEEYLLEALERLDDSEMRAEHLTHALLHSRTIGAAIGVLMAMEKITEAEAFDRLREASMAQNRKLYVLAQEVVDGGTL